MSSTYKVPIIKGLYSKFLPIEEQGCRAIYINAPVLYHLLCINRKVLTMIEMYGTEWNWPIRSNGWCQLRKLSSRFAFFLLL
jgi:hypothetical protein